MPGTASDFGIDEAAAAGVEVEQLGVAAPVDGGFKLALRLLLAELLVEHVEEELFRNGVVALGLERAGDLAQQQDVFQRGLAEELFLAQNLRVRELAAARRDGNVALFHA